MRGLGFLQFLFLLLRFFFFSFVDIFYVEKKINFQLTRQTRSENKNDKTSGFPVENVFGILSSVRIRKYLPPRNAIIRATTTDYYYYYYRSIVLSSTLNGRHFFHFFSRFKSRGKRSRTINRKYIYKKKRREKKPSRVRRHYCHDVIGLGVGESRRTTTEINDFRRRLFQSHGWQFAER